MSQAAWVTLDMTIYFLVGPILDGQQNEQNTTK